MKVAELIALLLKAPQDAYVDIYELDAVWKNKNLTGYLGSLDFEEMEFKATD